MKQILEDLVAALKAGGVRAMVGRPYLVAPRLQAPMTAVSIASLRQTHRGLGHEICGAQQGRSVELTISFDVTCPAKLGGMGCVEEGLNLLELLMGDFSPWSVGDCSMGACQYVAAADQFVCTVSAQLLGAVYVTQTEDTALVADFILEGEIL